MAASGQTEIHTTATVNKMEHWLRNEEGISKHRVPGNWRHSTGRLRDVRGFLTPTHMNTVGVIGEYEGKNSPSEADIMKSSRKLTDRDIYVVSSQLGASWRLLGLRLNFAPETLDAISVSTTHHISHNDFDKMAEHMLRPWSKLPTATVGRLAVVLWEMGQHTIALQLQP